MGDVRVIEEALVQGVREGQVSTRVSLAEHTCLRVGGPAEVFVEVHTVDELAHTLDVAERNHLPYLILGNGSNLLVRDGGVRGIVIRCRGKFLEAKVEDSSGYVKAGAGVLLPSLAHMTAAHGLTGFERFIGIPGTVGGALIMNAGIPEGALGDVVERVWGITYQGRHVERDRTELTFAYRMSSIREEGWIVTEAMFALQHEDVRACQEQLRHFLRKRADQPAGHPNAGSMFKNPEGEKAGRLIEQAGAKGLMRGGIQVSPQHGNFFINLGHGTAQDVLSLVEEVRDLVKVKTGIMLELEVQVVGDA